MSSDICRRIRCPAGSLPFECPANRAIGIGGKNRASAKATQNQIWSLWIFFWNGWISLI